MTKAVAVLLDLSDDVQEILEQQKIDLYQELQEEFPSVRLEVISDPDAAPGSRDLTTIIMAASTLVVAITPVVIRILNQFKPDTTEIETREEETHHPDGSTTIRRIHIYTKREYNRMAQQIQQPQAPDLPKLENGKDIKNAGN